MVSRRILIVDDEPENRSLSTVLPQHGFEVISASTVSEALNAIGNSRFDILVADLDIGEPRDGFTVVSAMRRTQPETVALILTGYPAFEAALEAIHEQVDEFLVKPIHPTELLKRIEAVARSGRTHRPLPTKRASAILREEKTPILERLLATLRRLGGDDENQIYSDKQMLDCLPEILEELCCRVESSRNATDPIAVKRAREHGRTRFEQGFGLPFILDESTALRSLVLDAVHRCLLHADLSKLFVDLATMSASLDEQLRISVCEYARLALGESERTMQGE